jgi:hypothetical protein
VSNSIFDGIWGGLARQERKDFARSRREAGHATPDFLYVVLLLLAIIVMLHLLGVRL